MSTEQNSKVTTDATKSSKVKKNALIAKKTLIGKRNTNVPLFSGVADPGLRRLARRAGVKRVSEKSFEQGRVLIDQFVHKVVRDAVIMSEAAGRKTVTTGDVSYSLKRNGHTLFGY